MIRSKQYLRSMAYSNKEIIKYVMYVILFQAFKVQLIDYVDNDFNKCKMSNYIGLTRTNKRLAYQLPCTS